MKKYFLSAFVIIVFSAYALNQRFGNSEGATVTAPTSALNTNLFNSSTNTNSKLSGSSPPVSKSGSQPTTQQLSGNQASSPYKNGQFTGDSTDAYYGNVQVKVIISGGKIADVQFLDYPQDRSTSRRINSQAIPYLTTEAIQAQSAQVDIISGATQTSSAFRVSLQSALDQAKN